MIDPDKIAETLASLPSVLRTMLAPFDDAALRARPAPGEWCVLEVIGHLITCDTGAFRDRVAAIVGGADEVPAFDGGAALIAHLPMESSVDELLDEFSTVRARSVEFVRSLSPDQLSTTAPYRDHGTFAASDFVLEWPYHDHEHVGQIVDAVRLQYLPHMTETMRSALVGE